MSVIIQSGFSGIEYPLNHPRIGWRSIAGTAISGGDAAGYPAGNALDVRTALGWRPDDVTGHIGVDAGADVAVSYCGVAGHTLGSSGAYVRLQRRGDEVTNILVRSEEFDNAEWDKVQCTITANDSIAPNGTNSADLLIADNDTSGQRATQMFPADTMTEYTASVYLKSAGFNLSSIRLFTNETGFAIADFDLGDGTVSHSGAATGSGIIPLSGGWFRVFVTFSTGATVSSAQIQVCRNLGSGESGNGVDGFLVWGAQINEGGLQSYIPTEASTVTIDWHDVVPWVAPKTDDALLFLFEPVNSSRYRLLIDSADAAPRIGHIRFGEVTEIPRLAGYGGTVPISESRQFQYDTLRANDGAFLGRSIISTSLQFQIGVQHVSEDWRRSEWAAFRDYANTGRATFFVADKPIDYPEDVAYAWSTEALSAGRGIPNKRLSIDFVLNCEAL